MNQRTRSGWRKVLRIAWPLIVANAFWNLQITVDRIFLGNFSTEALAASMAAAGIFWAPMALIQQTASYVTTFVAQYFGAKQPKMVGPSVWQAIYVSLAGGLLFMLLIPASDWIFRLMGHSETLQVLESEYFKALCYSAMPAALVATASGFFTGIGKSSVIMTINAIGVVVNIVFDYFLIFGKFGFPALGVAGAGYATTLANWCGALFGLYLVFSHMNESLYKTRSGWKIDLDLIKRFIKYGVPSGMQWALEGLAFTVFLALVGRMPNGDAALAASSITVTIMMLAILPAFGVAQGVSVLVGQNLGANRPRQAERASWNGLQIAFLYILLIDITFLVFPNFYLSWFKNAENQALWQEVSVMVPYLLMFVGVFILFDSMNLIFSFALKGAGDTRFVSLMALTLPWPLMIAPTWFVAKLSTGVYWAWFAASIYICFLALVYWRRFKGGKWKAMRVIHH